MSEPTREQLATQVRYLEAEVMDLRRRVEDAPGQSRGLESRLADAQRSLAAVSSQNERLAQTLRDTALGQAAPPGDDRHELVRMRAVHPEAEGLITVSNGVVISSKMML